MRARYYNVDIKRFVNQDVLTRTLERISSLNRYAYVEGNPVSFLDPFGLAIEILQNIVDIASIVVSCLNVFAFIAPEAVLVANTILLFITVTLDMIQLLRYGTEDKLDELLKDYVQGAMNILFPIAKVTDWRAISTIGKVMDSKPISIYQIIDSIKNY